MEKDDKQVGCSLVKVNSEERCEDRSSVLTVNIHRRGDRKHRSNLYPIWPWEDTCKVARVEQNSPRRIMMTLIPTYRAAEAECVNDIVYPAEVK